MLIELNLFWIVVLFVIAIFLFLIHSGFNVNLFVKKDENIANKFLDKFPLVLPDFMNKTAREQNIENNQEIHELNIELEELKKQIAELKGINNVK